MSNIIDNFGKDRKKDKVLKERHLRRIERDMKGNPLLKKEINISFVPNENDIENMKYQDHLGNPLPGYKWEGNKIVPA